MSAATDNLGLATRAMKQKAIYWGLLDVDEYGKPNPASPVEISCRWEQVSVEFVEPNGERALSRARLIVDRDLEVKGKLKLGAYDEKIQEDPDRNNDVYEIRQFNKTPNFRGTKYIREVFL